MKHKTVVYPNVHYISIHVDTVISERFVTEDFGDGHTDKIRSVMNILLSVPGVVGVGMKKYEITITKGEVFNWSSIIPPVLNIINKYFYDEDILPGDYELFRFFKASEGINGYFIDDLYYSQTPQEAAQERSWNEMY